MSTARPSNHTAAVSADTDARQTAARALHPSGRHSRALDAGVLVAIAEGLATVVDDSESAAPGVVRRTRLLDTSGYDAWLIVWGAGAMADDHDHAGSVGVVQVVAGTLTEVTADIDGGQDITRTIDQSRSSALAAIGRHTLANHTTGACVSVHVYSPPLGEPTLTDPEPT